MVTTGDLIAEIRDVLANYMEKADTVASNIPISYELGYIDATRDIVENIDTLLYQYEQMVSQ